MTALEIAEMSDEEKLRWFVRQVAEIPDPKKRREDDIDALYQNEARFADVIQKARTITAELSLKSR